VSPKRAQSDKDGDVAAALPGAVWFRGARAGAPRASAPALSRERIVAAAVGMLDERGTAGLSMRKLAERLDVHATSLYWHVPHRDDLLDLSLDAVFGEVGLPGSRSGEGGGWRADVVAFMDELRAALLRHPWSAPLAGSRPLLGPNALARSEFVYAALVAGGFSGADLSAAAGAVSNYVIGTVSAEAPWRAVSREVEEAGRRALAEQLRRSAETHPTLAAHSPEPDTDWDGHYVRGRDFLLAGLAAARTHQD
jgi:AcrR family transcriptional regulator